MSALPLRDLPAGSEVFVDANIFLYALSRPSPSAEALEFLRRCSREEVLGITLFEIVNEATHRFMLAEAVQAGHVTRGKAAELEKKPEIVRGLAEYWHITKRILDLNLMFLATERGVLDGAQLERRSAGLLTNDSMIAACMRNLGVTRLASNDHCFDRVAGVERFAPTDLFQ